MLADDALGTTREDDPENIGQYYYDAFDAIGKDPNNRLIVAEMGGLHRFMGWVPEMGERMQQHALTPYYKLLGRCLSLFLHHCRSGFLTETGAAIR